MSVPPGTTDKVKVPESLEEIYSQLHELEQATRRVSTAEELEALEREIRGYTDALASLLLKQHLQASLDAEQQQEAEAKLIAGWAWRLKSEGWETVWIRTVTGLWIEVRVRYYRRRCDRRKGKRYPGVYAGFVLLGIHDRCTPLLGALVSGWSALLSSFAEVRQVLLEQGVELGVKGIRRLSYRYADRARVMQQLGGFTLGQGETIQGRRVVISADGGRIRLRENKRGRKTNKNRTRYRGAWREPKLFIIYVVDEKGKLEKRFAPIIDASLQGPQAMFALLQGYLQSLALQQADHVLWVADGAHWIWNRIPALVKTLGLEPARVHELIDFYHAVEHLGKVAAGRKSGSAKERKSWVRQQRCRLLKGQVEQVLKAVRTLCRGRYSKAMNTERNDFVRNRHRMAYPTIKALKLPLGSGAVESAIRRVVNLRLKGPCIFWHKENAEKMLMLRAYYKAGRWNLLKRMANSHLSMLPA